MPMGRVLSAKEYNRRYRNLRQQQGRQEQQQEQQEQQEQQRNSSNHPPLEGQQEVVVLPATSSWSSSGSSSRVLRRKWNRLLLSSTDEEEQEEEDEDVGGGGAADADADTDYDRGTQQPSSSTPLSQMAAPLSPSMGGDDDDEDEACYSGGDGLAINGGTFHGSAGGGSDCRLLLGRQSHHITTPTICFGEDTDDNVWADEDLFSDDDDDEASSNISILDELKKHVEELNVIFEGLDLRGSSSFYDEQDGMEEELFTLQTSEDLLTQELEALDVLVPSVTSPGQSMPASRSVTLATPNVAAASCMIVAGDDGADHDTENRKCLETPINRQPIEAVPPEPVDDRDDGHDGGHQGTGCASSRLLDSPCSFSSCGRSLAETLVASSSGLAGGDEAAETAETSKPHCQASDGGEAVTGEASSSSAHCQSQPQLSLPDVDDADNEDVDAQEFIFRLFRDMACVPSAACSPRSISSMKQDYGLQRMSAFREQKWHLTGEDITQSDSSKSQRHPLSPIYAPFGVEEGATPSMSPEQNPSSCQESDSCDSSSHCDGPLAVAQDKDEDNNEDSRKTQEFVDGIETTVSKFWLENGMLLPSVSERKQEEEEELSASDESPTFPPTGAVEVDIGRDGTTKFGSPLSSLSIHSDPGSGLQAPTSKQSNTGLLDAILQESSYGAEKLGLPLLLHSDSGCGLQSPASIRSNASLLDAILQEGEDDGDSDAYENKNIALEEKVDRIVTDNVRSSSSQWNSLCTEQVVNARDETQRGGLMEHDSHLAHNQQSQPDCSTITRKGKKSKRQSFTIRVPAFFRKSQAETQHPQFQRGIDTLIEKEPIIPLDRDEIQTLPSDEGYEETEETFREKIAFNTAPSPIPVVVMQGKLTEKSECIALESPANRCDNSKQTASLSTMAVLTTAIATAPSSMREEIVRSRLETDRDALKLPALDEYDAISTSIRDDTITMAPNWVPTINQSLSSPFNQAVNVKRKRFFRRRSPSQTDLTTASSSDSKRSSYAPTTKVESFGGTLERILRSSISSTTAKLTNTTINEYGMGKPSSEHGSIEQTYKDVPPFIELRSPKSNASFPTSDGRANARPVMSPAISRLRSIHPRLVAVSPKGSSPPADPIETARNDEARTSLPYDETHSFQKQHGQGTKSSFHAFSLPNLDYEMEIAGNVDLLSVSDAPIFEEPMISNEVFMWKHKLLHEDRCRLREQEEWKAWGAYGSEDADDDSTLVATSPSPDRKRSLPIMDVDTTSAHSRTLDRRQSPTGLNSLKQLDETCNRVLTPSKIQSHADQVVVDAASVRLSPSIVSTSPCLNCNKTHVTRHHFDSSLNVEQSDVLLKQPDDDAGEASIEHVLGRIYARAEVGTEVTDNSIQKTLTRIATRVQELETSSLKNATMASMSLEVTTPKEDENKTKLAGTKQGTVDNDAVYDCIDHVCGDEDITSLRNPITPAVSISTQPQLDKGMTIGSQPQWTRSAIDSQPTTTSAATSESTISIPFESRHLSGRIGVHVTCLSHKPPTLPMREEVPSLGIELVYYDDYHVDQEAGANECSDDEASSGWVTNTKEGEAHADSDDDIVISTILCRTQQLLDAIAQEHAATIAMLTTPDITEIPFDGSNGCVDEGAHFGSTERHGLAPIKIEISSPVVRIVTLDVIVTSYVRMDYIPLHQNEDGTEMTEVRLSRETRVWEKRGELEEGWVNCHVHSHAMSSTA